MNLQHLKYIIEIENRRSISKAAEALYVSQPYLSRILKEEEETHGVAIFTRSKNGIYPTESGRLFLNMARELVASAENFQQVFAKKRESYRLRISSSICSHSGDTFVRMVHSIYGTPLRFTYWETDTMEVIEDVYTNRADVGVLYYYYGLKDSMKELLNLRHLKFCELFKSGFWLFCRSGHPILKKKMPISIEDIYDYNFALYPPQKGTRSIVVENIYKSMGVDWNKISQIVCVHSQSVLYELLTRTDYLGIGISPILEQEENYHIVSVPLVTNMTAREEKRHRIVLGYTYQKDRELTKAARAYITFLERCYGKNSEYDSGGEFEDEDEI